MISRIVCFIIGYLLGIMVLSINIVSKESEENE